MDESESDYNTRCLVVTNRYYRDHMKVVAIFCIHFQIYNINVVILTNNKLLESKYNENADVSVMTVGTVDYTTPFKE